MKLLKYLLPLAVIFAAVFYFGMGAPLGDIESIIIDPGHGADDAGCIYGGISEKDINYDIALRLSEILTDMGFKTELTHDGSEYISPGERAELANNKNADLYISIHQNAVDTAPASGIETWYSAKNRHSKRLAECIQAKLIRATSATDRGIKLTRDLIVVRETKMPSVLIECGFLSNEGERDRLATENYRQLIALSIAQAVSEFAEN